MSDVAIDIHRDLIEACCKGEHFAFQQLYRLYSRAMYNAALRIVHDTEEAEDILQEAFMTAFSKINTFKGDSTFGAWLKKIVVNKSINHLRKRNLMLEPLDDLTLDIAYEEPEATEYDIEALKRTIMELPDGYRVVLSLYLLEGYDHQEIGEILHISASTSKSQLNRAKNKLRSLLKNKEVYYG